MTLDPFRNFIDPDAPRSNEDLYKRKKAARESKTKPKFKEIRPGVLRRSQEWPTTLWVAIDRAADALGVPTSMVIRAACATWLAAHDALPGVDKETVERAAKFLEEAFTRK